MKNIILLVMIFMNISCAMTEDRVAEKIPQTVYDIFPSSRQMDQNDVERSMYGTWDASLEVAGIGESSIVTFYYDPVEGKRVKYETLKTTPNGNSYTARVTETSFFVIGDSSVIAKGRYIYGETTHAGQTVEEITNKKEGFMLLTYKAPNEMEIQPALWTNESDAGDYSKYIIYHGLFSIIKFKKN